MKKVGKFIFLLGTVCGSCFAASQAVLGTLPQSPVEGVDLGIADDETFSRPSSWGMNDDYTPETRLAATERVLSNDFNGPSSRPGISIAWRNAAQVEEVEVRVRNLGNKPGEGRIYVVVLDEEGLPLLSLQPPDEFKTIRIPAFVDGGREGKILRMQSSRELNNIIDQFDRTHKRYDVRAVVETVGTKDANPFDNVKTKSWNVEHRVEPGRLVAFNYVYKNNEDKPVTVKWQFERTHYPKGWQLQGIPTQSTPFVIQPGQMINGTLSMKAPAAISEGVFLESRLSLVDVNSGTPWQQKEWFLAHDTIPPTVADYRLVATTDHRISIQALVADQGSGVKEATGVTTQYSTDGGLTWAEKAHNYKAGNFVVPTLFEVSLGPFALGTKLELRFTAEDTVGNATTIIPKDASAIRAPAGAEKLLEMGHVFPRTQPNALFYLEPGNSDISVVAAEFASRMRSDAQMDPVRVEELEGLIRNMRVSPQGKAMLQESVKAMAAMPSRAAAAARLQDLLASMPAEEISADAGKVVTLEMKRVIAPGASVLGNMSTLQLTVQ
ncbi:hypothetical protein [Accumulibacter sp.]|uniref:hypothetical protein n=1 Tax=Accumulibacter sp. TaxID=2053492 RepID=UPI0028C3A2A5|nr:hypothetical protein [Accumulibacter sp.]